MLLNAFELLNSMLNTNMIWKGLYVTNTVIYKIYSAHSEIHVTENSSWIVNHLIWTLQFTNISHRNQMLLLLQEWQCCCCIWIFLHTQMQTYPETKASYAHRALHTSMLFLILEAWHNPLTWKNWTVSRFGRVEVCSCFNTAWPVNVKCLWLHKVHCCTERAADPTKGYQQPNRGIHKTFLFGINVAHVFGCGISPTKVKCISPTKVKCHWQTYEILSVWQADPTANWLHFRTFWRAVARRVLERQDDELCKNGNCKNGKWPGYIASWGYRYLPFLKWSKAGPFVSSAGAGAALSA